MASRPPSAGPKIKEPARTVEVACFLRYCLLSTADQLILMLQRRAADLWRQAATSLGDTVNWAELYQSLLGELAGVCAQGAVPDAAAGARVRAGVDAVAEAARSGVLRVDDELHLAALPADDEDPRSPSCAPSSITASARCSCRR